RTAFDLAVYASQGWSPTHHARLASGCWSGSTGRDWLPAGFHLKGFKLPTILLSRASWRDVSSFFDEKRTDTNNLHCRSVPFTPTPNPAAAGGCRGPWTQRCTVGPCGLSMLNDVLSVRSYAYCTLHSARTETFTWLCAGLMGAAAWRPVRRA